MKAQQRHKMHRNELLDWLNKTNEQVKPYSKAILGLGLLVILAIGAALWWARQSAAETAAAWDSFYRAMASRDPSELEDIIERQPGADVAHWAGVVAGDLYLAAGCRQLFSNKSAAADDLRHAIEHYRSIQEESQISSLVERATFGLGRAYEALAGTREAAEGLDKAIEAYRQLAEKGSGGPYRSMAARRLEDLGQKKTKAFYDRFATFDPKPAFADRPGASGPSPAFDLEGLSDDTFPAPPLPEDPGDTQPKEATAEPGAETTSTEAKAAPEAEPEQPSTPKPESATVENPAAPEPRPSQEPGQPEETPAEDSPRPPETPAPELPAPGKPPAEESAAPDS